MKQSRKRFTAGLLGTLLAVLMLCLLSEGVHAHAETNDNVSVDLQITYDQEAARSMLEYINLFRTGKDIDGEYTGYLDTDDKTKVMVTDLEPLVYDYTLEKAAMQRAAEIALNFAHTRPDGSDCFTAISEAAEEAGIFYWMRGENLAAGYSTAIDTFRQWREDEESYSGQGHRRNMLSGFNCIGIGHVVVNGMHFWTQALGWTDEGHGTQTAAAQGTRTVPVTLNAAKMTNVTATASSASVTVDVGMTTALPKVSVSFGYSDSWPGGAVFAAKAQPAWTVKNTSVAKIENGKLRGVAVGSTQLTGTVFGAAVTASVTCENLGTPTLLTLPADVNGYLGNTAVFSVKASGRDLAYKWFYRKSSSGNWSVWGSGQKLSITIKESRNGYQFRCRITDAYGHQLLTAPVSLKVLPKITAQPKAVSAAAGTSAKFTVSASGAGLAYQWQYRYPEGSWQNSGFSTAKTASLVFTSQARYNGIRYRCVITDANGKKLTSSAVMLTVLPKITAQPKAAEAAVGKTAKFTVTATGAGLTYQWQYRYPDGSWKNSGYSTARNAALSVPVQAKYNKMQYRCIITDANGKKLTSSAAVLTVKTVITAQPVNTTVKAGKAAGFQVTATGAGLTYQWQYRYQDGTWTDSSFATAQTDTLKLPAKTGYNGMQYRCVIMDANGKRTISSTVTLTVN